ncbi:copper resistance CopC family protein [Micromonospora sp. WMMD1155]|uniref:copper resistance CopC family protein n=1 Tax=Micromonospora sp. WMMD1155 TaxID=3016094 RepID=UPI00249C4EC7|nr:copper resistance CopC family protein [Micromonospora sp. WMMD1155]WFE53476.1 copper resistance protein CopC [Micromonospora sp. WMMD1155]
MSPRLGATVLAVLVALLVPAAPAWAHNSLRAATPVQQSTVTSAPTEIVLEFMSRLDPTFTTIVLTDAAKRKVVTGEPVVAGAKSTVQVTDTLPNGTYTVAYRVVSADGHPVQGSYPFTVADPTSSAAPVVEPAVSTTPSTAAAVRPDGGPNGGVLVAGVALVAVAAALLWRRAARRRSDSLTP